MIEEETKLAEPKRNIKGVVCLESKADTLAEALQGLAELIEQNIEPETTQASLDYKVNDEDEPYRITVTATLWAEDLTDQGKSWLRWIS